jgi:hypothetical protein
MNSDGKSGTGAPGFQQVGRISQNIGVAQQKAAYLAAQ